MSRAKKLRVLDIWVEPKTSESSPIFDRLSKSIVLFWADDEVAKYIPSLLLVCARYPYELSQIHTEFYFGLQLSVKS